MVPLFGRELAADGRMVGHCLLLETDAAGLVFCAHDPVEFAAFESVG